MKNILHIAALLLCIFLGFQSAHGTLYSYIKVTTNDPDGGLVNVYEEGKSSTVFATEKNGIIE